MKANTQQKFRIIETYRNNNPGNHWPIINGKYYLKSVLKCWSGGTFGFCFIGCNELQ